MHDLPHITLRDVRETDLAVFFEHQRDPDACEMAGFPPREYDAFISHWRNTILGDDAVIKRTITISDNSHEQIAGNIVCYEQDRRWLVGYWIGRLLWGRGIASAALRQFIANDAAHRPLHALVAQRNGGSIRVLEKCGFARIGEGVSPVPDAAGEPVREYTYMLSDTARTPRRA